MQLSLNLFTCPFDDIERRQYEICAAITSRAAQFRRNQLYPALQELIELHQMLQHVLYEYERLLSEREHPRLALPPAAEEQETHLPVEHPIEQIFELIKWAIPQLEKAIEEGAALFDFVDDNINLASVGVMPMYTSEGYVLVPEHRTCTLHVLRYTSSLLVEHGDNYRALRTTEVLQISHRGVWSAPETIKRQLVMQYPELPNPATFSCETDLDFPYAETILPVAKRKLIRMLS